MLDKEVKNERVAKNIFKDFEEWSKLHYYAFKLRKVYPNMFFHYFNFEGVIKDSFTIEERKTILTNLKKFKYSINGMCGYLSLLLKNKNGILTYKMLNNSEFYDHNISTPCVQDASSKFSDELHNLCQDVFSQYEKLYHETESKFEDYLQSNSNQEKRKEYKQFLELNHDRILYACSKTSTRNVIKQNVEENSYELNFIKRNESFNDMDRSSTTKSRKTAIDGENNEEDERRSKKKLSKGNNSSSSKNKNSSKNNINNDVMGTNYRPVNKHEWEKFVENSNSEASHVDNLTINETGHSSPNKYYLKRPYKPDYIIFDDLNRGYVSDQGRKVFKSDKKKYASDEEEFKTGETEKKKKILIAKSSNKKKNEIEVGVFSIESSEIKKLKRQLLNKKTKRNTTLNEISEKDTYKESTKSKKSGAVSQREHNSIAEKKSSYNKINSKKKHFKYTNMSMDDFANKSIKSWDDKSVSGVSTNSIVNNRKNKIKTYASSIKNFFSVTNKSEKKQDFSETTTLNLYKSVYSKNPIQSNPSLVNNRTNKSSIIQSNSSNNAPTHGKSILSFFPQVSNANSNKESEIIKTLSKLINNNKYSDILSLIEKNNRSNNKNNILDNILSNISSKTMSLVNTTNDIDTENLESIMTDDTCFQIDGNIFEFNKDQKENLKNIFEFYRKNTINFISDDQFVPIEENDQLSKIGENLKSAENLIKYIIKNYQKIFADKVDFTFNTILNEVRELFLFFLGKLFATKSNFDYMEEETILSEVLINRLIAFLMIIKVIYIVSQNNLTKANTSFIQKIKEMTNNFLKILSFLILIKLYQIDVKSLASQNSDMIIYISLFQIVSDVYSVFSHNQQQNIEMNNNSDIKYSFDLINSIFKDYLTPDSKLLDTNNSTDLKSSFIDICRKLFNGNFFDSHQFDKSFKAFMFKIFITQTNNIYTLYEFSGELKKIFLSDAILILYKRYFNLFILILSNPNIEYKNSNFSQVEEFYTKDKNDCYFDLDSVFKSIEDINLKKLVGLEIRKNLMYKYLLSDCYTILAIDEMWKMEAQLKMRIVFKLFTAIGLTARKNNIATDHINKKLLHKLLDFIFKENDQEDLPEENDSITLMNFVLLVCRIIRNTLLKNENDDKGRKRILTRFMTLLNENKNLYECTHLANTAENSTKLGILPIFAIILSLIEFTNIFEANDMIEICVKKISDILEFNKSSTLLKGFNIAILLRVILKFHKKKINIDKYVLLLNSNIRAVVSQIQDFEKLPNINDYNKLKNEHYETLDYYLRTLSKISVEDTSLLVNNYMILDELKEIVKDILENNTIPKNYKAMVFNIINNCCTKFESIVMTFNEVKNESENKLIYEGLEIDLDDMGLEFDDEGDFPVSHFKKENLNLCEGHLAFLENLNKIYVNLLSNIVKSFFNFQTMNNQKSNINAKQKISIELIKQNCEVLSKILAILIKFTSYKYSEFFQIFSFNSIFFSKKISKYFTNIQDYIESLTIPFKAFNNFLQIYPEFLNQILNKREYKFFTHFIRLFFYALFFFKAKILSNPLIQKSQNECSVYITEIISKLSSEKNLIEHNLNLVRRESESRLVSEIQREESSYYNILRFMIVHKNEANEITMDFSKLENYFDLLLQEISLNKNIFKIESKFFFSLIEDVEDIIKLFENVPNYLVSVRNMFLKILNVFGVNYLTENLNENSYNFITKFMKSLILEKFEDNDMTINLIYNSNFNSFIYMMLKMQKYEKNREILHFYLNILITSINTEIFNLQISQAYIKENPIVTSEIFTNLKIQENENIIQYDNLSKFLHLDQIYYLILILEYLSKEIVDYLSPDTRFTSEVYYYLIYSILFKIKQIDDNPDQIKELYEKVFSLINVDVFRLSHNLLDNSDNNNLFLVNILFSIMSQINFYFDSFLVFEYNYSHIEKVQKLIFMNVVYLYGIFPSRNKFILTKLDKISENIFSTFSIIRHEDNVSVHNTQISNYFTNYFNDYLNEYTSISVNCLSNLKEIYQNHTTIYEDLKSLEYALAKGNLNMLTGSNSERFKLFTEFI